MKEALLKTAWYEDFLPPESVPFKTRPRSTAMIALMSKNTSSFAVVVISLIV
jgi:hypothetical protein